MGLGLNWHQICDVHAKDLQEGLGTLEGFKASIYVDPEATPKFCKATYSIGRCRVAMFA